MKFNRIFLIILDSVGAGEAVDASTYNDVGANTIKHIAEHEDLFIPNLTKLGFLNTVNLKTDKTDAYYTIARPSNPGKDSLDGHYEMMGVINDKAYNNFYESGFPIDLIKRIESLTKRKVIGNIAASGNEIIQELGEIQLATGALIIYTSADSVLQVAANKKVIPLEELYDDCELIRKLTATNPEWNVSRVIARPFVGARKGEFIRTNERRDYALNPPQKSVLDYLKNDKFDVISIGKVYDLFNGRGFTKKIVASNNKETVDKLLDVMDKKFKGLCFANLNDFDSLYGHRRDIKGYKTAIEALDVEIPLILTKLNNDDLLIISADHGCDPVYKGSDHTRENVPVLVYSRVFNKQKQLPVLQTMADIGATIADNFDIESPGIGNSFLDELR